MGFGRSEVVMKFTQSHVKSAASAPKANGGVVESSTPDGASETFQNARKAVVQDGKC